MCSTRSSERGATALLHARRGGAYHRDHEGGRGGPATRYSAPVLVLEPGDVGLGHCKPTAMVRCRAAAPAGAPNPAVCASARALRQHRRRLRSNHPRRRLPFPVPWQRGRKQPAREVGDRGNLQEKFAGRAPGTRALSYSRSKAATAGASRDAMRVK